MLEKMFLQILNMSFNSSFVIILVLSVRLFLKKSPKTLSYALWGVVLFRLICPFSFESIFSLLPVKSNPIPLDIAYEVVPTIDTGIPAIDHTVNQFLPEAIPAASVNPLQIWTFIGSAVWIIGMAILLIYSIFSLVKLQKRLKGAVHERDNILLAHNLDTPFVMGIIRPKIYLPASLTEREKRYILLHEQIHIKRFDHIIKIISFFVLCLHWFNPLVWIAFFISGKDMEMSCDEAVIKQLGSDVKREYSSSLLTLATGRRIIGSSPLAFGEGDTKGRIKNVLNYKKPGFWVVVLSFIVIIILGIGLTANQEPKRSFKMSGNHLSDLQPGEIVRKIAAIIKANTGDVEISPDNFRLTVSPDFSWVEDEAIRILYTKNGKPRNAFQLRVFIDDSEFFITKPSDWDAYEGQIFPLQAYLEALKYLPQKEIASLCKESPQRYAIELSENGRKLNANRCLYYNKNGISGNNVWHIRLDIQPLYGDNESSFTGVGTDIIHVFYNAENSTDAILYSAEDLWKARTKYVGDNSVVGKIISLLQFPKGVDYSGFELHTSGHLHAITVRFKTDTETRNFYSGSDNQSPFQINALIMLSLIENVEYITFDLDDGIYDPLSIQYTSGMAKMILGDNYLTDSETLDGFRSQVEGLLGLFPTNTSNNGPFTQDQAIISALFSDSHGYLEGECFAEGHIILGTDKKRDETKIYALTMVGHYGFQNDNFVKISGTGVIPAVITINDNNDVSIEYPKDGSYYVPSIKKMFPLKYHARIFDHRESDRKTLTEQEQAYAKEYLLKLNRRAEIGEYGDFEHTLLTDVGVSVEVSNKLEDFYKEHSNYPYFIGTQEHIENNMRMVYKMSYDENQKEIRFAKYAYDTKEILEEFIMDATTGDSITLSEGALKGNL